MLILKKDGTSYKAEIEKGEKVDFPKVAELLKHTRKSASSLCSIGEGGDFHLQKLDSENTLASQIEPGLLENYVRKSSLYRSIEEELKFILDSTGELVTIVNNQGLVERVSSNCKQIMGIEVDEFVGRSIFELEKSGIVSLSSTKKVLETMREVTITQMTRGNRRLYVQGYPIFNENGSLEKILNISRDVTEESILRERLKQTEREMELLSKEANKDSKDRKIIVKSLKIEEIYYLLNRVAKTDATVLFLGETGVGKGVFAQHLHNVSDRKDSPFINVNCSVLPEHLIESELFGYGKGSFTGANIQGKKGLIEAADHGTLFLDEIGELPLQTQAKLLQVLQEKSFMPIGKTAPVTVDVRFIAATNKNLEEMVEKGEFRSDLYYRLNVVPITVPPLRERQEDIPFLLQHFLEVFNNRYNRSCSLSLEVIEQLTHYRWPGNVRELQNVIERIVITSPKLSIELTDLPPSMRRINSYSNSAETGNESLKDRMDRCEKEILLETIKKSKNLYEMSKFLKQDISTISRKLKKHNLTLQ
ncbi:sigma-54 interaction domain-containing protein [Planococcus salinus]|uniref:PAS domain-containing protein n=1 Tax=Planococcus salinus TaxID=1848460 RepID=A0A3M8P975_9BACL|nr:sigma 54-interacting transcriptional regulator [Planococcus salinus]RNF39734.1 PAS domain-containing protein [Planococcus salinus]